MQRVNSPKNQYKAVYTKYRSKKFLQVADIASLQQEVGAWNLLFAHCSSQVIARLAKKDLTDL